MKRRVNFYVETTKLISNIELICFSSNITIFTKQIKKGPDIKRHERKYNAIP